MLLLVFPVTVTTGKKNLNDAFPSQSLLMTTNLFTSLTFVTSAGIGPNICLMSDLSTQKSKHDKMPFIAPAGISLRRRNPEEAL